MKNFVQDGDVVTLTAPTGGVLSGQGFVVGAIFAVAAYDAAQGAEVEGETRGVFTLPKAAEAIDEGDKLYWDDSNGYLTKTSGVGLFPVGAAIAAAASGDATVTARLDGIATAAL